MGISWSDRAVQEKGGLTKKAPPAFTPLAWPGGQVWNGGIWPGHPPSGDRCQKFDRLGRLPEELAVSYLAMAPPMPLQTFLIMRWAIAKDSRAGDQFRRLQWPSALPEVLRLKRPQAAHLSPYIGIRCRSVRPYHKRTHPPA